MTEAAGTELQAPAPGPVVSRREAPPVGREGRGAPLTVQCHTDGIRHWQTLRHRVTDTARHCVTTAGLCARLVLSL